MQKTFALNTEGMIAVPRQAIAHRAVPPRRPQPHLASAYDVLMCYQIVLGRDPENGSVIDEAMTQPVGLLLKAFYNSAEFADQVASLLVAGTGLPHETWSRRPRAEHVRWLENQAGVSTEHNAIAQTADTWCGLLRALPDIMVKIL